MADRENPSAPSTPSTPRTDPNNAPNVPKTDSDQSQSQGRPTSDPFRTTQPGDPKRSDR